MITYKPLSPIYELATNLIQRSSACRLIHIGGSTAFLEQLDVSCELIWIGAPETESLIRQKFPAAVFMTADLEAGLPDISAEILRNSVVLCLDVLQTLVDPGPLTVQLNKIRSECSWLIITTPYRSRDSQSTNAKWSFDEFEQYL